MVGGRDTAVAVAAAAGEVQTGRSRLMAPQVTVIIAARDAGSTLADALASLERQTMPSWEAIVVDDGSRAGVAAAAAMFTASDARIHVLTEPGRGVCAARNRGVAAAAAEWLLFLEAEDALAPGALEALLAAAATDRSLGAVHGGWARFAADGACLEEAEPRESGDLFDLLARRPAFPLHACLVRRALVLAAGGWDVSLAHCEDWDLWQRVARTGARFGVTRERVALFGALGTESYDAERMLADGVRVLLRGHASDRRVCSPSPRHARGRAADPTPSLYHFSCMCAGRILAGGGDAAGALDALGDIAYPGLDPAAAAEMLLRGARAGAPELATRPSALWDRMRPRLRAFLKRLETRSGGRSIAALTAVALERRFIDAWTLRPLEVGGTLATSVDVTRPIPEVRAPAATRLLCDVAVEGEPLGRVELPVVDGLVPAPVLQDAIAAEFARPLLERFFTHGAYPERGLAADAHADAFWTVFLQELFGRVDWTREAFYDPTTPDSTSHTIETAGESPRVEIAFEMPQLRTDRLANVVMMLGGIILGRIEIEPEGGLVSTQRLRAAILRGAGFELCVAAVRDGLLGRPLAAEPPLRQRLAQAARLRATRRAAEWPAIADGGLFVLGRRSTRPLGTSASRRAALPAAAFKELETAAVSANEPVAKLPPDAEHIDRVVYAPDVLCDGRPSRTLEIEMLAAPPPATRQHDRHAFERIFAERPDPWRYESPYETMKYERTISLLGERRFTRALEVGCAEGHFTARLAEHADEVVASDIAEVALERARVRCARARNIHFHRLDVLEDAVPGRFDLIVASEVLYYGGTVSALRAAGNNLARALEPGGLLVCAHAHVAADDPERAAFDWPHAFGARTIAEVLAETEGLALVEEMRTPLYDVVAFERTEAGARREARVREVSEVGALPEGAAKQRIRWQASAKPEPAAQVNGQRTAESTDALPILAYQRIAEQGWEPQERHRVTPSAFEAQLRYLRDAGFYGVTLEAWLAAMRAEAPLPGRAVMLTFDIGFLDFHTTAWPLLRAYGFNATVFLVATAIGKSSVWDRGRAGEAPLMDWPRIRALCDEGVCFGSHSATHRPLTALPQAEAVREMAWSRALLERGLERPVDALAYPFGHWDDAIAHLAGACGYVFGLTGHAALSRLSDRPHRLPRIEIHGTDTLAGFARKLAGRIV